MGNSQERGDWKNGAFPSASGTDIVTESREESHSDHMMDVEDDDALSSDLATGEQLSDAEVAVEFEKYCQKETIPVVFTWTQGGDSVYLSGTFTNWTEKIEMRHSLDEFIAIHDLPRGRYAYKFIVDNQWCFSSDDPTIADRDGYVNNLLDLTDFREVFQDLSQPITSFEEELNNLNFSQEYDQSGKIWGKKKPPELPPHLREIILNGKPMGDSMGIPRRVTLNHLYCSAIKDSLTALATTNRYRDKYITTISYRPQKENRI